MGNAPANDESKLTWFSHSAWFAEATAEQGDGVILAWHLLHGLLNRLLIVQQDTGTGEIS